MANQALQGHEGGSGRKDTVSRIPDNAAPLILSAYGIVSIVCLAGLRLGVPSQFGKFLPYVVGYGFAVIVGHIYVGVVVETAWAKLREKGHVMRAGPVFAPVLADIERPMFAASWLIADARAFIVAWLAFKVAGQHVRGTPKKDADTDRLETNRAVYTVFLIGNALNLAYGVVGAEMVTWVQDDQPDMFIAVVSALILGTFALWIMIQRVEMGDNGANECEHPTGTKDGPARECKTNDG